MDQYWFVSNIESDKLIITKVDDVHLHVDCENSIRKELMEFFSFTVPGAHFMPSVRNKVWDGKIRLYDGRTKKIYLGLLPYILKFAKERKYNCDIDFELTLNNISKIEAEEFIEKELSPKFTPHDYQIDSFVHCIRNKRALILSPTGSGKSFIIYSVIKWINKKTLIVVPTTSLVDQMRQHFISYGCDENDIHIIRGGKEKTTNRPIVISTWQSIYKMPKAYFDDYSVVVGDECHLFKAKSLTTLMEKMVNCKYRFGFTGSLDGTHCHKLVLEGLFNTTKEFIKTKKLIDTKRLSDFEIKCLVLKYNKNECRDVSKLNYQGELDFIVRHERRIKFIRNLALSLKGNSLLLFQFVDKHGKVLYNEINKYSNDDRRVFFIHGGIDADERERIREITERSLDAIIVASYGTFSTGVDIINLHNVVFCSPYKSRIKNLQSIGRVLRKGESKDTAILFDIADDLRVGKKANHTLKHFAQRVQLYCEQDFPFKTYNIDI